MNRLDEIKERAKNTENLNNDRADVNWLLSALGDATFALKEIRDNDFLEVGACRLLANHAMQAIENK